MPKLVFQPSAGTPREFDLGPGPNYAGRGVANNIKLEDPSVSGAHAQIIVEAGRVIIKDLGSMNGTYINGLPVKEGILTPGQLIRLGAVEMVLKEDPAPSAPPARQRQPIPAAKSVVQPPPEPKQGEPVIVEGIPVRNPIAAEALLAARERLMKLRHG